MNIGIICYASVGGSGIVATELGKALAKRGHQVHFISTETPFRLGEFQAGLSFHQVLTPTYPLFREPQYLLSLSNKIVQVAREFRLDVIHAHYAIPHATAGFLNRHHAGRKRSVVFGDCGVLNRSIRSCHRRLEKPANVNLRAARCQARHRGHSEFSRLRDSPASKRR